MMQLFAYIRPLTSNLLKSHGRRSLTLAIRYPQLSSLPLAAFKPISLIERKIAILGFHTSSAPTTSPDDEPETPEEKYKTWLKEFRQTESYRMSKMLEAEENVGKILTTSTTTLGEVEEFTDDFFKLEKKLTDGMCECAVEWLPKLKKMKQGNSELLIKAASCVEQGKKMQSSVREDISLIRLRTELFLRFRLAVRQIVEPRLSAKVEKIQEDVNNGDYFVDNPFKIYSDYSLFLKQFGLDLKSGNLDSFLLGIGIENDEEFFEICEFALEGDQEAFFHTRPFGSYLMEEELSLSVIQFPDEFDREGILELIGKVNYSESMPKNCLKMVDYLSKLI